MIDPKRITNFERTDAELEEFALFCVLVAGKNSDNAAALTAKMLRGAYVNKQTPFQYLRDLGDGLVNYLVANRCGQYRRIEAAFRGLLTVPDLRKVTVDELEEIHGIGPKTARFFVLHSQPGAKHAVLDTHILNWMRRYYEDAPAITPTAGGKYREWEHRAMGLISAVFPHLSYADADLLIWTMVSGRLS